MRKADSFFDTNILLYLISPDHQKAAKAEVLMVAGGIVSVQVLNEFASVAVRKAHLSWGEVREVLELVRRFRAVEVAERYRLSFYDAAIVAAAAQAGCSTLWTEDMQAGQSIGGVRFSNPFA